MEVELTPEQEPFIIGLRTALDEAEADIAAGRYKVYANETLLQLAEELKQEARDSRR